MHNRAKIGLLFVCAITIGAEAYAMSESRSAPDTYNIGK